MVGAILAALVAAATGTVITVSSLNQYKGNTVSSTRNTASAYNTAIENKLKGSSQNLNQYVNDAYRLGQIDTATYGESLKAYKKASVNGIDSLNKAEASSLTALYNNLYKNDSTFRSNWNTAYSKLSNEEKLNWLDGATSTGAAIPAPAYMDTSFATYQKEVAPVKMYSNKELADLYGLDFNIDNILNDYKTGGQAKVDYGNFLSGVAKNMEDRTNTKSMTTYLDSIRNVKGKALSTGLSSGARAAGEVLANREAIAAKAKTNSLTATNRFAAVNDALLENAQAGVNANTAYTGLAQKLGDASATFYSNDTGRYGADVNTNASLYAADENLRANRKAANSIMSSIANNVGAQARAANTGVNDVDWLFKNIFLPANNNNVDAAVSSLLNATYRQNTRYEDQVTKAVAGL